MLKVLSVLQFAVPAWSTMWRKAEINWIESVQKNGLYLVYGPRYRLYLGTTRRKNDNFERSEAEGFEKFSKTCLKSRKFSNWFVKTDKDQAITTRIKK